MNSISKAQPISWGYGLFFALVFIANYIPTFRWMYGRFEEENSYSSHGYLIPFISAWLIWKLKDEIAPPSNENRGLGLLIFFAGIFTHLLSGLADVSSLSGLSMLFVLSGACISLWGLKGYNTLWFPILFLFFAIPLPDFIISSLNFKLKFWASDLASYLLNITGVPAVRIGSYMLFGEEKLAIGDVCSGLRSLLSLIALGTLYAWSSRKKGSIAVLASLITIIPAAIIGNGIRICIVSYLVFFWGADFVFKPRIMDYDIHLLTGFFIFAGALACLYLSSLFVKFLKLEKLG